MYWHSGKIISNFLKFSQKFSKNFSNFLKIFVPNDVGLGGRVQTGGWYAGYIFSICFFWKNCFICCRVVLCETNKKILFCGACFVY